MTGDRDERRKLISTYAAGPGRLRAALRSVPAAALKWRPAPGKWSVHEVVAHCADSEVNSYARIRFLLGEERPTLQGYDQDRWAVALDYHAQSLELSLAVIDAVRAATVPLLERLRDEAWTRTGIHTESGEYGTSKWLSIYAEHLECHARQIERNVAAFAARA